MTCWVWGARRPAPGYGAGHKNASPQPLPLLSGGAGKSSIERTTGLAVVKWRDLGGTGDGGAEKLTFTLGRGLAAVEPAAGDFAQRPPRLKADPPSGPSQCGGARPGHADVRALTPAVRDRIQADCRRGPAALPPLQRQHEPRVYRAQHRCGASCGFLTDTRRVGATLNQRNLDPQHPLDRHSTH